MKIHFLTYQEIVEIHDEEIADKVLSLIEKKITKNDLTDYIKNSCKRQF